MSGPAYEIEPRNKFFEANRAIVEYEIRPGYTVSFAAEVDLTGVENLRATMPGRKPSYTSFVVKAVALALVDFPYANRRVHRRRLPLTGARLQRFRDCDVGVAVERDYPGSEATAFIEVIRGADRASLAEITETLHALAVCDATNNRQWRDFSGVISRLPLWLSARLIRLPWSFPGLWVKWRGGSVLVSSPAKYGVDMVLGSWSHPFGVSFGLVKPRAVVRDGAVVARTTFTLTLNFDRRVMAGAPAARFFRRIVERLEQAEIEMARFLHRGSDATAPDPER